MSRFVPSGVIAVRYGRSLPDGGQRDGSELDLRGGFAEETGFLVVKHVLSRVGLIFVRSLFLSLPVHRFGDVETAR